MGAEGQELGDWEVSKGTYCTLGVGESFLNRGKRGQRREGGGVRVLEFGGLFLNRDRGGDRDWGGETGSRVRGEPRRRWGRTEGVGGWS